MVSKINFLEAICDGEYACRLKVSGVQDGEIIYKEHQGEILSRNLDITMGSENNNFKRNMFGTETMIYLWR